MSPVIRQLTPLRILFVMVIGSIAFFIYVYFSIGLDLLFAAVNNLSPSTFLLFYSASFIAMLLVMLLWAASWIMLLRALSIKLKAKIGFLYYMAGDFIDRIVPSPGIVGEVSRAYFVSRENLGAYGLIAAAGITNRIVAYGVVMGGLCVGIFFLVLTATVPAFASGLLIAVWLGALVLFVGLLFLSLREDSAKKLVSGLIWILRVLRRRKEIESSSSKVFDFLSKFHEGFKYFGANPRHLAAPIIFSAFSFILNFMVYILVFYALGLQLPFDFFIVVYFLAGAIQDGAAAFSVGSLEILLANIFILYGVQPAVSGLAAVTLRIVTYYFPMILGYAMLQLVGAKDVWKSRNTEPLKTETFF